MTAASSSAGRRAVILTVLALLWSVGLLVAALVAPVYGSATLVDENGAQVLLVVGAPAAVSAVVWLALWRRCSRGGAVSGYVAWTCVALLSAFCVVALASIGMFVAPAAILLAWAVSLTPSGQDRATPQP